MSDRFDKPHGHTEAEVKASGGMTGCPVCLRSSLRAAEAREAELRKELEAATKYCRDVSHTWIPPFCKKDGKPLDPVFIAWGTEQRRTEKAEAENAALKSQMQRDRDAWCADIKEKVALKARLEDVSCEFCEEGAKCCEKFDNSYGEMLKPLITVCTACWNRAAGSEARLALAEKVVKYGRKKLWRGFIACVDECGHNDCDLARALATYDAQEKKP